MTRLLSTFALVAVLSLAAGSARAQSATPPVLRDRVEATYPPQALRDRLEATVSVSMVVDETGHVSDARVVTPAGHGFDEAALDAVRRFTFEPARRDGVAIRSTVELAYEFHPPAPAPPPSSPVTPAVPSAPTAIPTQEGPDQSTLVVADRPLVPIGPPPERNAASDSTTDQNELSLRPRYRAEGLLEAVPGLFSVQHAGGGKAQQDFARGFNLDHGTDYAFFVDGVPVNAVSHAHGQGYSDLHFL
ncbi:MAG TPA: energy transducer TonB, partial [Polyangiaceae bacterium]